MLDCYSTYFYTTEKYTNVNKMFCEKETTETGVCKL